MKKKFRILKIVITVIIFGFLLSFSLKRFNSKPMEKVTVNMIPTSHPVYFVDEKDVREIVRRSNTSGIVGDIKIPELEKELNSLPAIDSANVYLNLNGNLNLDIRQKVPAFRLTKNEEDFYVDANGVEFPVSKNYSFPCMLVTGDVPREDYKSIAELVNKIDNDPFSKKFFIGISKEKGGYNLLTSQGNYKVEIGDLDNINLKVKGFKAFVEKFLVYQQPEKYTKVSVKYSNQIVTTLNPRFEENDSILKVGNRELAKIALPPGIRPAAVSTGAVRKTSEKPAAKLREKAKGAEKTKPEAKKQTESPQSKSVKKSETKSSTPKAKVKIE